MAEWLKAADCKSVLVRVRWFESISAHQELSNILKRILLFLFLIKNGFEKEDQKSVRWTVFPTRLDESISAHQELSSILKRILLFLFIIKKQIRKGGLEKRPVDGFPDVACRIHLCPQKNSILKYRYCFYFLFHNFFYKFFYFSLFCIFKEIFFKLFSIYCLQ